MRFAYGIDTTTASQAAYRETKALPTAVQLDLFTAIDEGAQDAVVIAARCHACPRGARIVCDYLNTAS
jgi:hypothetical protein